MTDIKRVGDAGIHTVEGNLAGSRAAGLSKKRDAGKAEYEEQKSKIKKQNSVLIGKIDDKFNAQTDSLEQEFRRKTIGLVTLEEFRNARACTDEQVKTENDEIAKQTEIALQKAKQETREIKRKTMQQKLSFQLDDEEDDNECSSSSMSTSQKNKKVLKNPTVDTSFLPDRERESELQKAKEKLQTEWLEQQEIIKNEMLEVVYSYWDGSGHRRSIQIKKGTSIGRFLELVKQQLAPEFHEMRVISADSLLYVKEDLIIPQHFTFYDLIITQARGKSGPLFHFDVHDDIRMINDARVEKDESHPGKIVERRWYEKNKHIFPASRWETYDPSVQRDKYSIHGGEINSAK